ncbi:MAG: immunoglobulin domain-containing protein [Verrucomicrobia bacterium]|nr:immunoglobulin domain-containing protein [Verrucomicrobiota bacterium]
MGASATSPASSTTTGVVEAFDVPDDLHIAPAGNFTLKGPVGGPFTATNWSFTLTNTGEAALDWVVGSSTNWLVVSTNGDNLATGVTATVTASLADDATNLAAGIYPATLFFTNTTSGNVQHRQFTLSVGQPDDFFAELFSGNSFDLDHSSITFTPVGGANVYSACRMAAGSFPTDPAGGSALGLTDDSFATVTLAGTNTVALYQHRTNTFFVCSNGYLTFDASDRTNAFFIGDSFPVFFSHSRVAGLMQDWNPDAGGGITKRELADRIAITYAGVPVYGDTAPNDFQIEMFYDGRIRITWLAVNYRNGLVGLSAGNGVPFGFAASDLSTNNSCAAAAPAIAQPASQNALAGDTVRFNCGADGSVPMGYQWKFNGTNLPAATNATLTLAGVTTNDSGAYALAATNAFGGDLSSNAILTVIQNITLPAALNAPNLPWATGGGSNWSGEVSVSHDGLAAAQSGGIGNSQESWLQTTVTNGPGTLTFWWRVSSELGWDFLEFHTNGVVQAAITGEPGWQQRTFYLPAGSQVLKWRYAKDPSMSSGQDRGWVDEVKFVPDVPLHFLPVTSPAGNLRLRLESVGEVPLEAAQAGRVQFVSSTNLALDFNSWLPVTNSPVFTNGGLELEGLSTTNAEQLFFRARQSP